MQQDYVTAEELAELLRLSPGTIKQMARDGRIPSIRLSRKTLRFDVKAVAAALSALAVEKEVRHGR